MAVPPRQPDVPPSAELAYLFRHAVLRDAAYGLQLPADRARLHRLALELIELAFGGPPPPAPADEDADARIAPHPTDMLAAELALHAEQGCADAPPDTIALLQDRAAHYHSRLAELARVAYECPAAAVHYQWQALHATLDPRRRARVVRLLGHMQQQIGARAEAQQTLAQAAVLAAELGDPLLVELSGITLANLWLTGGDAARALPVYERAGPAFAAMGRPREHATCVMNTGSALFMLGQLQRAEDCWNRAVDLHAANGDMLMVGVTLNNRGMARNALGRRQEARADFEQAVHIHRTLGNRWNEGLALSQLASNLNDEGDFDGAERLFRQALDIAAETGNRNHAATVLGSFGNMYMFRHQFARAEQVYRQAYELQVALGLRRAQGVTLTNLSEALRNTGRHAEALAMLHQSIAIHREVQNRVFEGLALGNVGIWHREQGQLEQAESAYQESLNVLSAIGHRHFLAIHQCGLARLRHLQGRAQEALRLLGLGLPVLEELMDKDNAEEARELLHQIQHG